MGQVLEAGGVVCHRVEHAGKVVVELEVPMVSLVACLKSEEFPKEPRITFKSFDIQGDSASLSITFTHGDGDIGLNAGDTFPPYAPGTPNYSNLRLDYQELQNGTWTTVDFPQAVPAP